MSLFPSRHPYVTAAAALCLGLLVFVAVYFQPQKLFINTTVKEAAPVATPVAGGSATSAAEVASGAFRSLEHHTSGRARLLRLDGGRLVLRLEGLDTSNGPVLRVILSRVPAGRGLHDYNAGYLDLGALKGNRGDQNYALPAGTDPSVFRSVVVWCRRFKVGFGVAPLTPRRAT